MDVYVGVERGVLVVGHDSVGWEFVVSLFRCWISVCAGGVSLVIIF